MDGVQRDGQGVLDSVAIMRWIVFAFQTARDFTTLVGLAQLPTSQAAQGRGETSQRHEGRDEP